RMHRRDQFRPALRAAGKLQRDLHVAGRAGLSLRRQPRSDLRARWARRVYRWCVRAPMTVYSMHRALQRTASQNNPGGVLKAAVRQLLASLGVDVLKTRTLNAYLSRYDDACLEIESISRQFVFRDLPERDQRVALLAGLQGTGLSEAMWVLAHLH